ncbi:hypothetical protein [Thermus sp.]|uniref:hypothetical protein n=1 Tax=Thermus sp. TaxID=275 RepID=UPI0025FA2DB7|nr:hypothetical protein [Thermus sp.]MCX7851049.1 hypothetical protein [Thermus sp.]
MEGEDEVLAFLEGLLAPKPLRLGPLVLHFFLDEEGRWTGALFHGEVLLALDWDWEPEPLKERLCRRYSSSFWPTSWPPS